MKKILFVEDDSNLSGIVQENLEDLNYFVRVVESGEEALSIVRTDPFDLVLMDIELSGKINGFEAADKIRELIPNIPFLFATGRQSGNDLERGFGIGNMDYVRKPYRIKELTLRIEGLIGSTQQKNGQLIVGKLTFNTFTRRLSGNGQESFLNNQEAKLLQLLANPIGKVIDKEELYLVLWGENEDQKSKEGSLHNLIYNLRKHLKADASISVESIAKKGYTIRIL
jgi:DNA-binding response OmpR family regulator